MTRDDLVRLRIALQLIAHFRNAITSVLSRVRPRFVAQFCRDDTRSHRAPTDIRSRRKGGEGGHAIIL